MTIPALAIRQSMFLPNSVLTMRDLTDGGRVVIILLRVFRGFCFRLDRIGYWIGKGNEDKEGRVENERKASEEAPRG